MTSRVTIGFHRLGVTLAVPLLLVGTLLAAVEWKNTRPVVDFGKNDPIVRSSSAPRYQLPSNDLWAAFPDVPPTGGRAPDYSLAMLIAALGIGLYAVSRATGWVLAGFIGR